MQTAVDADQSKIGATTAKSTPFSSSLVVAEWRKLWNLSDHRVMEAAKKAADLIDSATMVLEPFGIRTIYSHSIVPGGLDVMS